MLETYKIGNNNLGISLVIRNLFDKKFPTRRYIRLIFSFLGTRTIFEFRFANSI
jgi:hypothetical protein